METAGGTYEVNLPEGSLHAASTADPAALTAGSRERGILFADLENNGGHIPNLDGLRAISILIVMLSHFVTSKIPGGLGVYVFFVISGFLISRQMFQEHRQHRRVSLKNFYIRRFFRLYPVTIVYTAVVVAGYLALGMEIDWLQPASAQFYFANYYYADLLLTHSRGELMPFQIFWSLSVEEHFYLLFPTVFVLLRGDGRRIAVGVLGVLAAALALRIGTALVRPDLLTSEYFYYRSEFRLDSIAFGVGIAALCELAKGRLILARLATPGLFLAGLALIFLCLAYRDDFFRETFRYSVLGIAITAMVVSVLFSQRLLPIQRALNSRALTYIGKLSYSLYIWHLLAPMIGRFVLPDIPAFAQILVSITLALGMAAASYHLLEKPLMGLRKRLHAT